MLSSPDGPFINLARLDMSKYAAKPTLAKALFEYIFHHENDIRNVRWMRRLFGGLSSTLSFADKVMTLVLLIINFGISFTAVLLALYAVLIVTCHTMQ